MFRNRHDLLEMAVIESHPLRHSFATHAHQSEAAAYLILTQSAHFWRT